MEVDGVGKEDYWKVVDQCYLCDLCYMTKCPYVPPHPWNVDFPHVMLRAKAIKFDQGVKFRDRLLSSTDAIGKLAAIPVVAQTVNLVNRTPLARSVMQATLGVHKERELPPYASRKFRSAARKSKDFSVRDGANSPGKVAIFSTCYVNYNEPGLGHDLLAILEHNEIPYLVVEQEACCGMPKFELGDLKGVEALKKKNLPMLARYARDGYAILAPVPSCTLMFKQELPLMYPQDAVRDAMFDPFEYFVLRRKEGLLKTDFKQGLGRVSYHIPCHSRVQNMGQKTREMLEAVPGTELKTVERCAGHDGTWGVKEEYFENSMKIGRPVFRQMAEAADGARPRYISSDCPIAGRHIQQGMGEDGKAAEKAHPLTLLRRAYGI
jgi:Fe-S oxidoreductase